MKILKSLQIVVVLFLPVFCYAQDKDNIIEVTIKGQAVSGMAYLQFGNKSDSAKIENNRFSLNEGRHAPDIALLKMDYSNAPRKGDHIFLFLQEGTIKLLISPVTTFYKFEITGPMLSVDYEWQLSEPVNFYNNQINSLNDQLYSDKIRNLPDTSAVKRKLTSELQEKMQRCYAIPQEYARKNPGSILSVFALEMLGSGSKSSPVIFPQLQTLFAGLSDTVKTSPEGIRYAEELKKYEQWYNAAETTK